MLGERLSQSRAFSSKTSLSNGVVINVTATALAVTKGRWKLIGCVGLHGASGTNSITFFNTAISQTSATLPGTATYGVQNASGEISLIDQTTGRSLGVGSDLTMGTFESYVDLAADTTFYLTSRADWGGGGTMEIWGSIQAIRVA
jgi:hypothetical protein